MQESEEYHHTSTGASQHRLQIILMNSKERTKILKELKVDSFAHVHGELGFLLTMPRYIILQQKNNKDLGNLKSSITIHFDRK